MLICLTCLAFVINAQQLLAEPEARLHFSPVFTQGLIIKDNIVWESSGLYSKSMLTKWNLKTGKVIKQRKFDDKYFAEGLTELNGHLYMLTWREETAFEIDPTTLETLKTFHYKGEGWGLTSDGKQLIMSDGSSQLKFIDPKTFKVSKTIDVHIDDLKIDKLNELEWIKGKIWANVYQTDYIVVIEPKTGEIIKTFNLSNLSKDKPQSGVLNGIAYDSSTGKIWLTGKNWRLLFSFDM